MLPIRFLTDGCVTKIQGTEKHFPTARQVRRRDNVAISRQDLLVCRKLMDQSTVGFVVHLLSTLGRMSPCHGFTKPSAQQDNKAKQGCKPRKADSAEDSVYLGDHICIKHPSIVRSGKRFSCAIQLLYDACLMYFCSCCFAVVIQTVK